MRTLAVGVVFTLVTVVSGAGAPHPSAAAAAFAHPVAVTIQGYHGDAMEPFVSPDGKYLFFNNRNDPATNTDLFFARRINDTTFAYSGPIHGADGPDLDAVASMDAAGHFYFVSTRSYTHTLATIYRGTFSRGVVSNVAIVPGLSKATPGWVNFDADVSADGNTMYFVDGRFDQAGHVESADLVIAKRTSTGFARLAGSARMLARVNTDALEYGAAISDNGLTLYFTRAPAPLGSGSPSIYVTTRSNTSSAFGPPTRLTALTGFVEAPALSPDGRSLYFHKLVGDTYEIFRATKT